MTLLGRGGGAIGKFDTHLHPHDRVGKFAKTFHVKLVKHSEHGSVTAGGKSRVDAVHVNGQHVGFLRHATNGGGKTHYAYRHGTGPDAAKNAHMPGGKTVHSGKTLKHAELPSLVGEHLASFHPDAVKAAPPQAASPGGHDLSKLSDKDLANHHVTAKTFMSSPLVNDALKAEAKKLHAAAGAEIAKRQGAFDKGKKPLGAQGQDEQAKIPGATAIVRGKAGRWTKLNGKMVHIPHHDEYSRKIGEDTFTSPKGSTAVYKNGAMHNAPRATADKTTLVKPAPIVPKAAPSLHGAPTPKPAHDEAQTHFLGQGMQGVKIGDKITGESNLRVANVPNSESVRATLRHADLPGTFVGLGGSHKEAISAAHSKLRAQLKATGHPSATPAVPAPKADLSKHTLPQLHAKRDALVKSLADAPDSPSKASGLKQLDALHQAIAKKLSMDLANLPAKEKKGYVAPPTVSPIPFKASSGSGPSAVAETMKLHAAAKKRVEGSAKVEQVAASTKQTFGAAATKAKAEDAARSKAPVPGTFDEVHKFPVGTRFHVFQGDGGHGLTVTGHDKQGRARTVDGAGVKHVHHKGAMGYVAHPDVHASVPPGASAASYASTEREAGKSKPVHDPYRPGEEGYKKPVTPQIPTSHPLTVALHGELAKAGSKPKLGHPLYGQPNFSEGPQAGSSAASPQKGSQAALKPEHAGSGARSSAGRLRNFKSMSDAKLTQAHAQVTTYNANHHAGGDQEGESAVTSELQSRGIVTKGYEGIKNPKPVYDKPIAPDKPGIGTSHALGGEVLKPELNSPGRSSAGRMRNYKAMSDDKLATVLNQLTAHGNDPEAMHAAQEEAKKRASTHGFKEAMVEATIEAQLIAYYAGQMQEASDKGAEPFSTSKTSNWVAKAGGLPHYIQHIAHDLMEKRGLDESRAIAMAVGIVKRWARGGGDVKPDTRAAAAKAVAEWEAKKARAHATP